MNKKIYDGYTYVDGGVCAAKGFTANGLNCGLNPDKNKNDLGMVFSEVPCVAAGVYTQNKVKGAPVTVTKEHLKKSGGSDCRSDVRVAGWLRRQYRWTDRKFQNKYRAV